MTYQPTTEQKSAGPRQIRVDTLLTVEGKPEKKKGNQICKILISLNKLVGRARLERATNGLKVRCSTD